MFRNFFMRLVMVCIDLYELDYDLCGNDSIDFGCISSYRTTVSCLIYVNFEHIIVVSNCLNKQDE